MDKRLFGRGGTGVPIPDLMELQIKAYEQFLQKDVHWSDRDNIGIESILRVDFSDRELTTEKSRSSISGMELGSPQVHR